MIDQCHQYFQLHKHQPIIKPKIQGHILLTQLLVFSSTKGTDWTDFPKIQAIRSKALHHIAVDSHETIVGISTEI